MKYYIDFDNTIFNTVSFYDDFINLLKKHNIDNDYIEEFYRVNGMNPLALIRSINNQELKEEYKLLFNDTKKYLYPDAIEFLKNKKGNQLILYSQGYLEYQYEKIIKSGVLKEFNNLIICEENKVEMDLDYQKGIFIDDNPKVIINLLNKGAKTVYRIKRSNNRHSMEELNDNRVIEIFNMNEIKD